MFSYFFLQRTTLYTRERFFCSYWKCPVPNANPPPNIPYQECINFFYYTKLVRWCMPVVPETGEKQSWEHQVFKVIFSYRVNWYWARLLRLSQRKKGGGIGYKVCKLHLQSIKCISTGFGKYTKRIIFSLPGSKLTFLLI